MKKILTSLLFAVFALLTASSQNLDDILSNYYEAIGGTENWSDIKSMKMTGNMSMQGMELNYTVMIKAPDKLRSDVKMGDLEIVQAYDGETGWMINPMTGSSDPQKMDELTTNALKSSATLDDPFIDFEGKGYTVTLEGTEDMDGISCYVLKLDKGENEPVTTYYLDKESYLPLFQKQMNAQMGQEVTTASSDFQDIGNGMIMPYSIETTLQGQTFQTMKFTEITVDEDLADDIFAYPGE